MLILFGDRLVAILFFVVIMRAKDDIVLGSRYSSFTFADLAKAELLKKLHDQHFVLLKYGNAGDRVVQYTWWRDCQLCLLQRISYVEVYFIMIKRLEIM